MKTIEEGNKLIAEFMGRCGKVNKHLYWVNIPSVKWVTVEQMQFHTSWDWLMPVVEKINEINILKISSNLGSLKMKVKGSLYGIGVDNTIEDVWKIVVLFIKTYNEECSE